MSEATARPARWRVFAPDTAGAIYGTIVAMAVIAGTAADPGHGKALWLTVATLCRVLAGPCVRPDPVPPPQGGEAAGVAGGEGGHGRGAAAARRPAPDAAWCWSSGSCTCSRVARPSGWPCGSAWPSWSPGASSTRAGSGGAGRRRSPRARSTACSGWRSCSSRWSCTDRGHGCPAAASTAGWAGRRPRNSMSASTTSSASVRPRTTLPVGRPQNTRARAARATAPMRRAFLLAYTQVPTGPVENPARSAPRPASRWRC